MKKFYLYLIIFILILSSAATLQGCSRGPENEKNGASSESRAAAQAVPELGGSDYWPGESWETSAPEEQGMDSEKLADMLKYIQNGQHNIHSIVLIRNGHMIMDANFYPYKSDVRHAVNSCTKSITSALLGIAAEEGLIGSSDDKVIDFFPDRNIQNMDARKKGLSLKHLLTMTAGLDWSENGSYGYEDSWMQMTRSNNPVNYFLEAPMLENPGTSFYYNTGASHMLSAILQNVTAGKTYDYARKKLFEPIGIKDVYWSEDREGINIGGAGIFMTPRDMARFGYLFLRNGNWGHKQVIPEGWVQKATEKQIDTPSGLAGRYGYGYQWWMNSFGGYSARGYGGQYIFVLPQYDIVAVFTSALPNSSFFLPEDLVSSFVIPAVKYSKPIKDQDAAATRLRDLQKTIEQQPAQTKPTAPMPKTAGKISDKIIECENGDRIYLKFNAIENQQSAEFRHGPSNNILIGLNDIYRVSDAGVYWPLPDNNLVAAKGFWEDENRFTIKLISLHETDELTYKFTFEGDTVNVEFLSEQGGELMNTKGKIK